MTYRKTKQKGRSVSVVRSGSCAREPKKNPKRRSQAPPKLWNFTTRSLHPTSFNKTLKTVNELEHAPRGPKACVKTRNSNNLKELEQTVGNPHKSLFGKIPLNPILFLTWAQV